MKRQLTDVERINSEMSFPHKVLKRLDEACKARGIRSYRGYSVRGDLGARLNFDHFTVDVGPYGLLERKKLQIS